MKELIVKRFFLSLPVLAVLAAVQPAAAQPGRPPRPTFAELDADGNGSVTEDEFVAPLLEHASEHFAVIDTNDDGVVTEAELAAAPFGRHGGSKSQ
jgi:hypothetical protein